jgi:very-short-patch-repair endonuclease
MRGRTTPWQSLLREQDQVMGRRQARLLGMSEDAWQWGLDTGRWRPLLRGVVVGHSGPPTDRQRAWAAVLSAGDGGRLTGDAALRQHGLALDVRHHDVLIPAHRRVRMKSFLPQDGAAGGLVRPRQHGSAVPVSGRGLPLVAAELAALHAAEWAPSARAGEWRVAAAVQTGTTTVERLRAALPRAGVLERRDLLSDVLDDVELGAHARSELDLLHLLRDHGLPLPDRLQRPVRANGKRYLDAWWERQRVAAEVDGAHHRAAATWDTDTLRQNEVVLAERHDRVLLLRLTTGNLRHDRSALVRQFRAALL